MNYHKKTRSAGFTMTELIIAIAVTMIAALGVGMVISNSQRAYAVTYEKAHADVITDSYVARRLFDSTARKSSSGSVILGLNGESIQFRYYNNDSSTYLDRYKYFYVSGNSLMTNYGNLNQYGIPISIDFDTVCSNVSSCVFKNNGSSVSMILSLDDGDKSNTLVTSAYTHN